jgi:hypothetical protein
MIRKSLLLIALFILVNAAPPVFSSPINGPTSTYVEVKVPGAGVNDFHIVVDVTNGNPTIKNSTGKITKGASSAPIANKPTDSNIEKDGSNWTYKWSLRAGGSLADDVWKMGIELDHDNTMIIKDAFWTVDSVPTNDKVPLPEWRVVGKEQGGQDPLAYILANPYNEILMIDNLAFLLPVGNIPLALEDLGEPFSATPGILINIGAFSLASNGMTGDSAEFFFDGSGMLPLLDPGATLNAEFTAGFQSMGVDEYIVVRTQHAVPESASAALLVSGTIIMAISRRRKNSGKNRWGRNINREKGPGSLTDTLHQ